MFRNILATLALLCLFATPAMAGEVTTFEFGPARDTLLLRSQTTTIGTSGFCVDLLEDITASIAGEACDATGSNEVIWPKNAQVRNIVVRYIVTGDTSDICDFVVEVAGTAIGTAVAFPTQAAGAVSTKEYKINLADDDLVGIMVADGTSCASSAEYVVELWGSFLTALSKLARP
jgi:hypothetical protein